MSFDSQSRIEFVFGSSITIDWFRNCRFLGHSVLEMMVFKLEIRSEKLVSDHDLRSLSLIP